MTSSNLELATFAAGCFWKIEEIYGQIKGVKSIIVGYTRGWLPFPSYREVCTGKTGHAEAIQIQYDKKEVTYNDLLSVFWMIHDPTSKNRQGFDIGSQYRSMILFHTNEQENLAINYKDNLEKSRIFKKEIVTEIVPASTFYFYKAEEYHQKLYEKRSKLGYYCPKIGKREFLVMVPNKKKFIHQLFNVI